MLRLSTPVLAALILLTAAPAMAQDTPAADLPSLPASPAMDSGAEPDPTAALEIRIREARQRYRANHRLGTGLLAAGAATVMVALDDWAAAGSFGMESRSTSLMLGGMGLMAWGTHRHRVADRSLERARTLEESPPQ